MLRLLYQFPTFLQRLYGGVVWRGDEHRRVVYLTFDDGPEPQVTLKILDILKEYGAKATFFMVGENVERYPQVYARVVAEGHAVGNHTMHHLKGFKVRTETYCANVEEADRLLHSPLFRPPYGRMRWREKKKLREAGYTICLWDVLVHDYNKRYSSERMLGIVKRYTRNGSILNFHDSLRSGERLLDLLPEMLAWLQGEGYAMEVLGDA